MDITDNDLREIDTRIKLIERAANELSRLGTEKDIPAVHKNADRILAAVNVLKLEVSDVLDLHI